MQITHKTREEIARLVSLGYNKWFARDANDESIIWEISFKVDR